jgi:1-acyl-sn-glycerol-3-phosphate acyltransferase
LRNFAKVIANIVLSFFFRIEVINKNNIPNKGAALLCANHTSELDMFFIGIRIKRWVHYIAKEELFKNPVMGLILKKLGAFPVKRGKGDVGAIRNVFKLLEEGHIVGIFPEGTRLKGKVRDKTKIKPGAALIAINSSVPIIPVAVDWNRRLFSRVKIIIGEPFNLDIDKGKKYTSKEMVEISSGIMDKVYSLMED